MQEYHYKPLSPNSIRVALLLAGQSSDALHFQMLHVQAHASDSRPSASRIRLFHRVFKEQPISYEALSYVWGPPTPTDRALCDGKVLHITRNLATAARRLRLPDRSRTLWIDQICINQDDPDERAQQVVLMGNIYRNAEQVISWLGEDPDEYGPTVQRFLQQLVEGRFKDVKSAMANDHDEFLNRHNLPVSGAREWRAVNAMVALPYFTRVWILQEVILAHRVIVMWGKTRIPFEFLTHLIRWVMRNHALTSTRGLLLTQKNIYRLLSFDVDRPRPFEEVILKVMTRYCTIGVDRIYSILSLITDGLDIRPNYSTPEREVFRDVTLQVINLRQSLSILSHVYHWDESSLQSSLWPTWVPRWNGISIPRIDIITDYTISESFKLRRPQLLDGYVIEIHGIRINLIDVVRQADCGELDEDLEGTVSTDSQIREIWEAWLALIGNETVRRESRDLVQDFILTLLCGVGDRSVWMREEREARLMRLERQEFVESLPDQQQIREQICRDFAAWWANQLLKQVMTGVADPCQFVSTRMPLARMAALAGCGIRQQQLDTCPDVERWEALIREKDNLPDYNDQVEYTNSIIRGILVRSYDSPTAESIANQVACLYVGTNNTRFKEEWLSTGIARSFFILEGGYIGMGPRIMRKSDIVVIFAGSPVPHVLRPIESRFMLVGDCYVHGLMRGEFIKKIEIAGLLESQCRTFQIC